MYGLLVRVSVLAFAHSRVQNERVPRILKYFAVISTARKCEIQRGRFPASRTTFMAESANTSQLSVFARSWTPSARGYRVCTKMMGKKYIKELYTVARLRCNIYGLKLVFDGPEKEREGERNIEKRERARGRKISSCTVMLTSGEKRDLWMLVHVVDSADYNSNGS